MALFSTNILRIFVAVLVEQIFSLSFFRILSRLSFGIYLLHFIPLSHRLFAVRDTYVMTSKILVSSGLPLFFALTTVVSPTELLLSVIAQTASIIIISNEYYNDDALIDGNG